MDMTASLVCRAFLEKLPPEKREVLESYLPFEEQNRERELPTLSLDPTQGTETEEEQLERIHYSWFAPFLRTLSEQEIKFFAASLPSSHAEGLKKILLFTNHLPSLSKFVKKFLQKSLLEKVSEENILPVVCLPSSALNDLLYLTEREWKLLISLLGVHDVNAELRLIIETAKLKRIQTTLTKEQQFYLKSIGNKKEMLTFGRMLDKWDGKAETLQVLIQQRGINRLAKAFQAEDPSLLWHFSHVLDMETAAALKKLLQPIENRRALAFLVQQILEVVSFIKNQIPA